MSTWIVNSDTSLQKFIGDLREAYFKHRYIKISAKVGKDRSLDQNAISHAWYEQLARELKEDDALGWKSYCKLHHGVPILGVEDEKFRAFYNASLRNLSYEQKLEAMKFVPITSLMTKPQLSRYLENMQADFLKRGVRLEFPAE
jgi:hypothetical protein